MSLDLIIEREIRKIARQKLNETNTYGFPEGKVDSGKVVSGGEGGDWGGSMERALEVAKVAKEFMGKNIISSQKRSKVKTNSGNVSDHWEGNLDAYAVDLATGTPNKQNYKRGDELFAHLMDWMGHPEYKPGKWVNINKNGYRYQFGWRTPEGDHENHIHVGVKKKGGKIVDDVPVDKKETPKDFSFDSVLQTLKGSSSDFFSKLNNIFKDFV